MRYPERVHNPAYRLKSSICATLQGAAFLELVAVDIDSEQQNCMFSAIWFHFNSVFRQDPHKEHEGWHNLYV